MIVYCEGVQGGLDLRLLEAARQALARAGEARAHDVELRPASSHDAIQSRMSADRANGQVVGGLRDRDYLPRDVLNTLRANPAKAFPLSRFSVESDLMHPDLLAEASGRTQAEVVDLLETHAEALFWPAAVDGTIQRFNRQHRRDLRQLDTQEPTDEASAQAALATQVERLGDEVAEALRGFPAAEALVEMANDLRTDGPLWTRVDGKRLWSRVQADLAIRGGLKTVLGHIEDGRSEVPAGLVAELRAAVGVWFGR